MARATGRITGPARDLVFISYSHKDKSWLEPLLIILKPYVKQGRLALWADPYIQIGDRWQREIDWALGRARVAVFLVSPNFLASDFITEEQVPPLLAAAEAGDVTIFAVPVKDVDVTLTPFEQLQWARDPKKPLAGLRGRNRDKALVELAKRIDEAAPPVEEESPAVAEVSDATAVETITLDEEGRLGPLYGVPDQRPHFIPRESDIADLKSALLAGTRAAIGVTGSRQEAAGRSVGLHGMGGIGKTVLAIALAQDEDVRRAFPDSIHWMTLGQDPDLERLQAALVLRLTGEATPVRTVEDGRGLLRAALADKRCLLIVDDAWQAPHARAFDALGPQSRLLITTRDAGLVTALGAQEVRLDVLAPGPARALLAEWTGQPAADLPDTADEVAEHCGGLPLALSVAAAMVRDGTPWGDVRDALAEGDLAFLDHPYGNVFKPLRASVEALPEETAARYIELAVFPEDLHVPAPTIERLWRHTAGLKARETRRLLAELQAKGLLYFGWEAEELGVSFHDLQHDFLRLSVENLSLLHATLLDSFRGDPGLAAEGDVANWPALPADEPYLWDHLAYHLAEAGRHDELRAFLFDVAWLRARLAATDVNALAADFNQLPGDRTASLVQEAVRLSDSVLAKDSSQLAGQLLGRLADSENAEIERLLDRARVNAERPWLRPLRQGLIPPGGPLIRSLAGHEGEVIAVAVDWSSGRALSGSEDGTLKLWDLARGEAIATLAGHADQIPAVAVDWAAGRALSGSWDNTLKLWDLAQSEAIATLAGHKKPVTALAVDWAAARALSGSWDKTLKLWDLARGKSIATFTADAAIATVALAPDGATVLGGDRLGILHVLNLEDALSNG